MKLNKYTRLIEREYNEILFKNAKIGVGADGKSDSTIDPSQGGKANDYLVCAMSGKTQAQVNEMSVADFDAVLTAVNDIVKKANEEKKN